MITSLEYSYASKIIGCDVPAIKAVQSVESGGKAFLDSGKLVLKFEGHIFHKYTGGKFDQSHPELSYPAWTEEFSQFGELSYRRFNQAFRLDPQAAMKSTSWGAFQIMGFNFSSCGFKSVGDFVTFLRLGEGNHLVAFCRYIKNTGLASYLVKHQWAAFAYRYNGADYKKHHYDLQLESEYEKFNP